MRGIQRTATRGRTLVLLLVLALPGASRLAYADEALLDKGARRGVAAVALALARKAQVEAFGELLEILRALGTPPEETSELAQKGADLIARARKRTHADPERKKLAALAATLSARLAQETDEPARGYLAGVLLRLDSDDEAARAALGHVRHAGQWTPTALVPLVERRAHVEALVARHARADYAIETAESDEPGFRQLHPGHGAVARHASVEVHVARTGEQGARRVLLQALRGWGLAAELAGVPPGFLPKDPLKSAFHGSSADYVRSIELAVASGRLPASEAEAARDQRTYRTKDGYFVSDSGIEAHHQTFALFDLWYRYVRRHWDGEQPLPCLEAPFLNWVMLRMLGCPLPRIRWRETEWEERLAGTLNEEENKRLRELLRLSAAGLAGTRAYLRFLMERRLDPPWEASFRAMLGEVRGAELLKGTLVVEYLMEADLLRSAFAQTVTVDAASVEATRAGLETAIGRPLSRLEADLRLWLLHRNDPGLLQRLAAPDASAPDAANPHGPLAVLDAARQRALVRPAPLALEPELSAGAAAHARYLARHPAQAAAWPDAHEEYSDRESYSPAGARAGASSVIFPGCPTWRQAIDGWLGTFFHRLPLLDPGLLAVGAGLEGDVAVLDTGSIVEETVVRVYVCWPPADATGVPRAFVAELPNPVPGEDQSAFGYPITLQVYADDGQPDIDMQLLDARAKPVPCWFSAPHAPLNGELVPPGAYALIPKAVLPPHAAFTVDVRGLVQTDAQGVARPHALRWTFRTGS